MKKILNRIRAFLRWYGAKWTHPLLLFLILTALLGLFSYLLVLDTRMEKWILGALKITLLLQIGHLACTGIAGLILGRTGRDVTYTGNDIAAIPHLFKWQKEHYFPAGARDIKVRGDTMAFEWECRLSEKDFLDYAKRVSWSVRRVEKKGKDILSRGPLAPYYEYRHSESDGGGLTLRYSVPEGKFYGSYAHH